MKPLIYFVLTLTLSLIPVAYATSSTGKTPAEQLTPQVRISKGTLVHKILFAEKDIRDPYLIITIVGLQEKDREKFLTWREEIGKKLMESFNGKIETNQDLEEAFKILGEYFTKFTQTGIIGFGVEFPKISKNKK